MTFTNWLKAFVDETNKIDEDFHFVNDFYVNGERGQAHYTMSDVVEFLFIADEAIQTRVKDDVVKMDFYNRPSDEFQFYFNQVAKAMANVFMVDYANS